MGANLELSPWRERLSAHGCPEVMVLKWIPATSAEVEIIGDASLLSGCSLLSLPLLGVSLCRGHTLCHLLSLWSKLNATADRLWPWRSVALCCSAVTMTVYFLSAYTSCQIRGCSAICPHSLILNSGWTGGRCDASHSDKNPLNLWLNYSKNSMEHILNTAVTKSRPIPFHTDQINLKTWKKK